MVQGMSRDAWDEFSKPILVRYVLSYLCGTLYLDPSASLKRIFAFSVGGLFSLSTCLNLPKHAWNGIVPIRRISFRRFAVTMILRMKTNERDNWNIEAVWKSKNRFYFEMLRIHNEPVCSISPIPKKGLWAAKWNKSRKKRPLSQAT